MQNTAAVNFVKSMEQVARLSYSSIFMVEGPCTGTRSINRLNRWLGPLGTFHHHHMYPNFQFQYKSCFGACTGHSILCRASVSGSDGKSDGCSSLLGTPLLSEAKDLMCAFRVSSMNCTGSIFLRGVKLPKTLTMLHISVQGAATTVWAAIGKDWEGTGGK